MKMNVLAFISIWLLFVVNMECKKNKKPKPCTCLQELDTLKNELARILPAEEEPERDGGWSDWSAWGDCSATCNAGLRSRTRTCSSPAPTNGMPCEGNYVDKDICNTKSCPAPAVIFSVTQPSATLVGNSKTNGVPSFQTILTNIGNGYNKTTGEFKCVVPGTYQFSLFFMSQSAKSYCIIRHNKGVILYVWAGHAASSSYWNSAATSTYLTLAVADVVYPQCHGWNTVYHGKTPVFNGALVVPN